MIKNPTKHTLSHKTDGECSDIAYNGRQIYISTCNKQVIVLDDFFAFVGEIPTPYSYRTLCYDNLNKCFWAASLEKPGILFQLSDGMDIKKELKLSLNGVPPAAIDCFFCDEPTGHMMAAVGGHIYKISPAGQLQSFIKIEKQSETPLKICALPDRFLFLSSLAEEIHLKQYLRTTGEILSDEAALDVTGAKSMIVAKYNMRYSNFTLLILTENDDFSPCLTELQYEKSNVSMQQLSGNRARCPYCMGASGGSHSGRPQPCGMFSASPNKNCFMPPFPSFQEGGDRDCCDAPGCSSPACRYRACTQVIESIALTETSIAHILNAEGEKLQKAIACCRNVNELMKINESVMRTIIHTTQLEQMLFYKLDSALRGDICECQTCGNICCAQSADININAEETELT